ncbi:MAG: phage holin family protein [Anaerostipes sp.]|jgi:hypothetical protein
MNLGDILNNYVVLLVVGICFVVGYIIKKWVPDVDNKIIPTVVAVLGCIINVWVNEWTFNPQILLAGLISGLASTGLHQAFSQWIEKDYADTSNIDGKYNEPEDVTPESEEE